jgi:SAM-dependent methyltransferase
MIGSAADDSERFAERYRVTGEAAQLAVELDALGGDYQGNGYTTMDQADELGRLCELRPGSLLVDVGSGCGWPGLYLADRCDCSVVAVDRVIEGVEVGARRALRDGLGSRSLSLCGDAGALPLRSRSVDAVVHTDLVC